MDNLDQVSQDLETMDPTEIVDLSTLPNVGPNPNRQKPKVTTKDLWNSQWGIMLLSSEIHDPTSFIGKKWITRFRVPFPVNNQIVQMCKEANVFQVKSERTSIPVEFKVLISLRILAKNHDSETLNELSLVGASTCNLIFRQFVLNFRNSFFRKIVYVPEGEELRKCIDVYKIMGFNGCFGSIDCTHVRWNKCPSEWQNFCIGKEGFPIIVRVCG